MGATSWRTDESFAAFFSNYGKKSVGIFAPGRSIHSAQPEDCYARFDGTSLSAPIHKTSPIQARRPVNAIVTRPSRYLSKI